MASHLQPSTTEGVSEIMRLLITALMTISVAATAACNRGATVAAATAGTVNAAAEAAGEPNAAVATSGGDTAAGSGGAVRGVREVTIPAGTRLPIVLDTAVSSATSRVEESVQSHLSRPVVVHGRSVLPQGSRVSGVVIDATQSGRVKGLAHIALRFDTLVPRGDDERYRIQTAAVGRTAPATKKKDAAEIGVPAAGGALIGALVGGKKGALVGGAAGGGAGTAVVLSTRGKEVTLPRGAALTLRLTEPITVRVKA
jgi:hypothetical protein